MILGTEKQPRVLSQSLEPDLSFRHKLVPEACNSVILASGTHTGIGVASGRTRTMDQVPRLSSLLDIAIDGTKKIVIFT
jgi:hypothetical protein